MRDGDTPFRIPKNVNASRISRVPTVNPPKTNALIGRIELPHSTPACSWIRGFAPGPPSPSLAGAVPAQVGCDNIMRRAEGAPAGAERGDGVPASDGGRVPSAV